MDAVAVQVASGAVVVLGGAWLRLCAAGMSCEDLAITQRHTRIQSVGDRGVPQRVWADVAWDASGLCDPKHHPVAVAPVDRLARQRAQY